MCEVLGSISAQQTKITIIIITVIWIIKEKPREQTVKPRKS
jgi:hypothetical protein